MYGYSVIVFDAETQFFGVDNMGRYWSNGNQPKVVEVPPTRQHAKR